MQTEALYNANGSTLYNAKRKHTVQRKQKHTVQRKRKHTVQFKRKHTVQRKRKHTVQFKRKHTVQRKRKHTVQHKRKHSVQRKRKCGDRTAQQTGPFYALTERGSNALTAHTGICSLLIKAKCTEQSAGWGYMKERSLRQSLGMLTCADQSKDCTCCVLTNQAAAISACARCCSSCPACPLGRLHMSRAHYANYGTAFSPSHHLGNRNRVSSSISNQVQHMLCIYNYASMPTAHRCTVLGIHTASPAQA